jgi:hypothetical protein
MKTITLALIIALAGAWDLGLGAWGTTLQAQEAVAWRSVAESIPLGSKVKVETIAGKRTNGALMRVDSTGILVKKNTRYPEPAVAVTFDEIVKLERNKEGGMNVAKAIGIGVGAGAGAMLTLILFAMQLD